MDKKYMLISVCDREILTEQFDTKKEAQETMYREMIERGKVSEDIFSEKEYEGDNCGFGEYCAWANDGINHADFDWLIVAL